MFYVPIHKYIIIIKHACIIIFILYSLPYFKCFIAVILNTLYAFYDFMVTCACSSITCDIYKCRPTLVRVVQSRVTFTSVDLPLCV